MSQTPSYSPAPTGDWQQAPSFDRPLCVSELSARISWFIQMRWVAAVLCALGSLASALNWLPVHIDYWFFLLTTVMVIATNLIFTRLNASLLRRNVLCRHLQSMVVAQSLTDYVALSFLSYGLGGMETPVVAVFIFLIIVLTLLCEVRISLLMTLAAAFFAALPLALEYLGVLPVISIYDHPFKNQFSNSLVLTSGYILFVSLVFLICWYLVSEVTTHLRLREEQLAEAYQQMAVLHQEKSRAMLRATHELKAPLAAIKSYVNTMQAGYCGEFTDKVKDIHRRIGDRSDLLTRKITDIIHLSNLQTLMLHPEQFLELDLAAFMEPEVEQARVTGALRGIEVQWRIPSGVGQAWIRASREQLHTLISNVLQNAVTYSYDGGTVEVWLDTDSTTVKLEFRDHGIGIPEANLPQIFDEHFRSHNAARHNPNGNGLGLAMVKEIVRLHNAQIEVASASGQGTCFTLIFNRVPCPA